MHKPISLIVAIAENFAIGNNNELLCFLPGDLKRFKEITTGHKIIMGRKTWESLPRKPLPNRENIVLTNTKDYKAEGAKLAHSIDEALALCDSEKENFIVGGAKIYESFLPLAQKLYITHINKSFEADTFFPTIDFSLLTIESQSDIKHTDDNIRFQYINYTNN